MSDDSRALHGPMARFVNRLWQVVRQAQVYGDRHPALDAAVDEVLALSESISAGGEPVSCSMASPFLIVQGTAARPSSELQTALLDLQAFLADRGLGGIRLSGQLGERDVLRAVRALLEHEGGGGPGPDVINEGLVSRGVDGIAFLAVRARRDQSSAGGAADEFLAAMRLYLRGVRAIQRLLERGVSPAMELELRQIAGGLVEGHRAAPHRMLVLATPRQLVPYALRHPVHMAIISVAIGARFGLDDAQLEELAMCALLVDAGMGAIPAEVRDADGALTAEELAAMRLHPVHTVQRLLSLPVLSPQLRRRALVAFEHHLGVDWKGYPSVNRWVALHPYSRIVSVADGFDALRANRPGRRGMGTAAALEVLHGDAGSRYDPLIVEHLEGIVRGHLAHRNAPRG